MEADFAGLLVYELERRRALVVEFGSGALTVLLMALMKTTGAGRLVSVEHDAVPADQYLEGLPDPETGATTIVGTSSRGVPQVVGPLAPGRVT